jgi:hypothetical protein
MNKGIKSASIEVNVPGFVRIIWRLENPHYSLETTYDSLEAIGDGRGFTFHARESNGTSFVRKQITWQEMRDFLAYFIPRSSGTLNTWPNL